MPCSCDCPLCACPRCQSAGLFRELSPLRGLKGFMLICRPPCPAAPHALQPRPRCAAGLLVPTLPPAFAELCLPRASFPGHSPASSSASGQTPHSQSLPACAPTPFSGGMGRGRPSWLVFVVEGEEGWGPPLSPSPGVPRLQLCQPAGTREAPSSQHSIPVWASPGYTP